MLWRMETQDAIGGMKVYTATKEFLDSAFVPVLKTGEVDKDFGSKTSILIRPSGGLVDALNKETISFHPVEPIPSLTSISKFGSGVNMHGSHFVVPSLNLLMIYINQMPITVVICIKITQLCLMMADLL